MIWFAIIAMGAACYLLKLMGFWVPARVLDHPVAVQSAELIPVALLGALIAVQVFADGSELRIDARLLGLTVAAGLLALRAPFLPVVFLSAAAAALARLWLHIP